MESLDLAAGRPRLSAGHPAGPAVRNTDDIARAACT